MNPLNPLHAPVNNISSQVKGVVPKKNGRIALPLPFQSSRLEVTIDVDPTVTETAAVRRQAEVRVVVVGIRMD